MWKIVSDRGSQTQNKALNANDINATSGASPKIDKKSKEFILQSEKSNFRSAKSKMNDKNTYLLWFRVEVNLLESLVHLRTRKICVFLENRFCRWVIRHDDHTSVSQLKVTSLDTLSTKVKLVMREMRSVRLFCMVIWVVIAHVGQHTAQVTASTVHRRDFTHE